MEILRVNVQSKYSVGRYDTFAVDKKLILIFSVGDLFLGLSAVFLAEITQINDIDYNVSSKNIIGSVMIRDEKIPVFDILGYFGIDSKGAVAIKADEGVVGGGRAVATEKGEGDIGVSGTDSIKVDKRIGEGAGIFGIEDGEGTVGIGEGEGVERGVESIDISPEGFDGTSTVSMIILKRGLGDSSELQRIGIVVDHIEGVLDEGVLDRFPFPEIALNKSTKVYQGLMMYSGNLVLLLNIPWLMEMILPSG
jgi:chemotaxis signal transduction protein